MPQCEMCGTEKPELTTAKIEGAELQVCSDCADFGTEVRTQEEETTSTKYSTGSGSGSRGGSSGGSATAGSAGQSGGRSGGGRRDMFDEMDEVAPDYDQRIRRAREGRELSQSELADQLNEKASLIRKLERGESLPSDRVRRKLERALDIDLVDDAGGDEAEWSGGEDTSGVTLGDVVERKE